MDGLATQCAAQSVGTANQLFGLLIQTILAAQCSISPPSLWPENYGEKLVSEGILIIIEFVKNQTKRQYIAQNWFSNSIFSD